MSDSSKRFIQSPDICYVVTQSIQFFLKIKGKNLEFVSFSSGNCGRKDCELLSPARNCGRKDCEFSQNSQYL